jgi:RNA polymerase sigma factor (sigma-70 family)
MAETMDHRALFLEQLDWIDKVASIACRKAGVWDEDAEDFASWVKMKLIEDDYADIRAFLGQSSLKTYLATVVTRKFHEYQRERWGRWRPSAAAERLGDLGRQLEVLIHRDGCRLEQAAEQLRTAGRTTLSDAELARLAAQLPTREPLRPVQVGAAALETQPGDTRADARVVAAGRDAHRDGVLAALARVKAGLDAEEQLIVQLHWEQGRKVSDVSRALDLDQKALYRRLNRLKSRLRQEMEAAGVSRDDVRVLTGEDA